MGGGGNGERKSEPTLERCVILHWYERAWYTAEANRVGEDSFSRPSLFSGPLPALSVHMHLLSLSLLSLPSGYLDLSRVFGV